MGALTGEGAVRTGAAATGRSFIHEFLPARIVFGAGSRHRLPDELERLRAERVLVVVTPDLDGLAAQLLDPLGDRVVGRFTEIVEHVPLAVAERARAAAARSQADTVVSIGGGSSTGTAKMIALTSGLPILSVPTTYAGSEVTPVWGFTEHGHKTTGTDPRVLPRAVVYDPDLTATLPAAFASASAFNAIAHCIDAMWASRRSPISDLVAGEGLTALARGVRALVTGGLTAGVRNDLLYGSYLAGTAFAVAGAGLHHKICHVLGGALDLPHARTHAVVLPHVLAFNAPAAPDAARRIAEALDTTDAVGHLRSLSAAVGMPSGLRQLGMPPEQVEPLAELITSVAPPDNPRRPTRSAIRELLSTAWTG